MSQSDGPSTYCDPATWRREVLMPTSALYALVRIAIRVAAPPVYSVRTRSVATRLLRSSEFRWDDIIPETDGQMRL